MYYSICSVSASPFMWAKLGLRLVMHAGSCTAWNMVSNQMDKYQMTRPLEGTTPLIPSLVRQGQENMFPGPSLLT